jgi:hypothetical protein
MNSKKNTALLAFILVLAFGLLSACNFQSQADPNQADQPGLVYTAAAQTVAAQLTLAAAGTPIVPATLTPQVVVQPSATQPVPTQLSPATATNIPTNTTVPPTQIPPAPTNIPVPCDRASFVKDVSYPDDTEVLAGTSFVKTWQIKNNGTCTWNSGYSVVFINGDSMGAPATTQLTNGVVAPGETVNVSVNLTAPATAKTYKGNFQLRNPSGANFGIGLDAKSSFWVQIKVITQATATPTLTPTPVAALQYDFVANGPAAEWRTATGVVPWGDPAEDKFGFGFAVDNRLLEDGRTYNKVLVTLPEKVDKGTIRGRYSSYTIVSGDHFRATIGLATKCTNVKWRYHLKYEEGGIETLLGEWLDSCDGKLIYIDKDLSSLAGKTVNFLLSVTRESGNLSDDLPYWVYPRIER